MSSEVNLAGKRDTHQTGAPTPWLVIWRSATSMGCKGVTTGLFSSAMMWNFREPSGSANGLGRTILMVIVSLPWKRSCHTRRMAMGSLTSNWSHGKVACMWLPWPSMPNQPGSDVNDELAVVSMARSRRHSGMIPRTTVPVGWWHYPLMDNLTLSILMSNWNNVIKALLKLGVIDGGPLTSMLQSSCSSCSVSLWPARQSPYNPQQRSLTCGIELRLLAWICLSEIPPSWFSTSLMCT